MPNKQKLKIAQIVNIAERVPPHKYGGSERVVYALTEELVKRGHQMTLFASGDSKTSAKLVAIYPKALRFVHIENAYGMNPLTLLNIGYAYQRQDQFDIIHDHTGYFGLPVANIAQTPTVLTIHGYFGVNERRIFENLKKPYLVSISKAQAKTAPKVNFIANVYHGLKMDHFPFSDKSEGYLLCVGRISPEKGMHLAIEVAQYLDLPLVIAAKLNSITDAPQDVAYFKQYIEPKLSEQIRWIGEVDENQRNKLMSKAICLLHPVTWPEPFGLAMIETMACGTPVVAFGLGSIPEIVQHGKTGYVVNTVDEMIEACSHINKIERYACREYALNTFNTKNMVDQYEQVYYKILHIK